MSCVRLSGMVRFFCALSISLLLIVEASNPSIEPATRILQNGLEQYKDGSFKLPDGTIVTRDCQVCDYSVARAFRQTCETRAIYDQGQNTHKLYDRNVTDKNKRLIASITSEGRIEYGNGVTLEPDGIIKLPNGDVSSQDHPLHLETGPSYLVDYDKNKKEYTFFADNWSNVPPITLLKVLPNGSVKYGSGLRYLNDGRVQLPDGITIEKEGIREIQHSELLKLHPNFDGLEGPAFGLYQNPYDSSQKPVAFIDKRGTIGYRNGLVIFPRGSISSPDLRHDLVRRPCHFPFVCYKVKSPDERKYRGMQALNGSYSSKCDGETISWTRNDPNGKRE